MKTDICYIYELMDPITNEIRYVGKAKNPKRRLKGHYDNRDKYISKNLSWIKGLSNKGMKPILNCIDAVSEKEWEFWEQYYISLYKSWGFNLNNMTAGGDGMKEGYRETKNKISETLKSKYKSGEIETWNKGIKGVTLGWPKGKKKPEYLKKQISETKKAKYKSGELINPFKGKKHSEETLKKLSNSLKGRKSPNKGLSLSDGVKNKISETKKKNQKTSGKNNPKAKETYKFDLKGNFVDSFETYTAAYNSCFKNNIRTCVLIYKDNYEKDINLLDKELEKVKNNGRKDNKHKLGHVPWNKGVKNFMCEESMEQKLKNDSRVKEVYQIEKDTNDIIRKFRSSQAAANHLGNKNFISVIKRVCKGERQKEDYKGYKWAYVEDYDKN